MRLSCVGLSLFLLVGVLFVGTEAAPTPSWKNFDRFILFIFENRGYNAVMKDPYFAQLASRGSSLVNFYAITHPSQPNYIAQLAGATLGCTSDSNIDLPDTSVLDLFEEKGISWRFYEEAYPGNCFTGSQSGTYVRKHDPAISFTRITHNATRCAHVVPATQIDVDMKNGPLPQFVYYTPDLNNDAHDTTIAYASKWLQGFLEPRLTNPNFYGNNTVIFITWDEDDHLEGNHIYSVIMGPNVKVGYHDTTAYNHYSVTRTLEDNWGVCQITPGCYNPGASMEPRVGLENAGVRTAMWKISTPV